MDALFMIKKIVSPLFFPLPLLMIILVCGVLLLNFSRRRNAGKFLITLSALLLLAMSYSFLPNLLLKSLERQYRPLFKNSLKDSPLYLSASKAKWIVVLGGGVTTDPSLPPTSQLSEVSLARIVEGVRIYRELPQCRLVVSGGRLFDKHSEADVLSQVARSLGVPERSIVSDEKSPDTETQALLIGKIVKNDPFILVTSASHMPRAMALFARQGMKPIPAPAGYMVREANVGEARGMNPRNWFPSPVQLEKGERSVYEYLGIIWGRLMGKQ